MVMAPMVLSGAPMLEQTTRVEFTEIIERLPLMAAVMAGRSVDIAAGPETGPLADLAHAVQRCDVVKDRLRALKRQIVEATKDRDRLEVAVLQDPALAGEVEVGRERVADLGRRVLQARTRVQSAEAEVIEMQRIAGK
jgi:hypothetical protein